MRPDLLLDELEPLGELDLLDELEPLDELESFDPFADEEVRRRPLVPAKIAQFADRLGKEWSRRRNGSPSASAISDWLVRDYQDTLEGARRRWKASFGKGRFTADAIGRAWMTSRQEQMQFKTASSPNVKPLRNFAPSPGRVGLVSSKLIHGSDVAPVAPIVVRFVEELRRRYRGFLHVTNYRGHGGGSFNNRGYSLDLFLKDLDKRGFYWRQQALNLLRAVKEAADVVQARWRIIYNDFSVADAMNRATGQQNVIFVGKVRRDRSKRVIGLNWHGPAPLILHFHLDLAPGPGRWTGESAELSGASEAIEGMMEALAPYTLDGRGTQASAEFDRLADLLAGSIEAEAEGGDGEADEFWPVVLRVVASGASRLGGPLFRAVGRRLAPGAARAAARSAPGVFVRGSSTQARAFARKVGGTLIRAERHGSGLPHYHIVFPNGRRIHVWFARRIPRGDFLGG